MCYFYRRLAFETENIVLIRRIVQTVLVFLGTLESAFAAFGFYITVLHNALHVL